MTDNENLETADTVRVNTEFPARWGTPKGESGTAERRAWIIGSIRADGDDSGRDARAALRQAEHLRDS